MECEENGDGVAAVVGRRGVKRKRRAGSATDVRLGLGLALPGTAPLQDRLQPPRIPTPRVQDQFPPFPQPSVNVNLMEEITFWICTRRAPCLYRYNNVYKKKNDEAHCSKYRQSDPSLVEEVPSPKKKKRKLKLLHDDESGSSQRRQNVYFEKQHWYSSSETESDDDGSDIDFNIKNCSIRNKTKAKCRKNRTTLNRKNKIITSTPKPTALRRSLRKTQPNVNNSNHLNATIDILNSTAINGDHKPQHREYCDDHNEPGYKTHTSNSKRATILKEQTKNEILPNGQFEDISDVSGFTANYIRSTKVNTKTPRKIRSKASRNLGRDSQQLEKNESKIIVCINKSVNTPLPAAALNQSTDSSQNVINLVTVNNNNNGKTIKLNKSTSQLKYLNATDDQNTQSDKEPRPLNISFQSKSSGVSRYPTRHRSNSKVNQDLENSNRDSAKVKKNTSRGLRELRSINQNQNPDVSLVSRTRSGKKIGVMDLEESGCSQDNVMGPVSSAVAKSVTPANKSAGRKKHTTSKKKEKKVPSDLKMDTVSEKDVCIDNCSPQPKCSSKKPVDKTKQCLKKDSLRDKSGFSACFSDSEEDKPLIRRKFFC